jgi:hypothetical protein
MSAHAARGVRLHCLTAVSLSFMVIKPGTVERLGILVLMATSIPASPFELSASSMVLRRCTLKSCLAGGETLMCF